MTFRHSSDALLILGVETGVSLSMKRKLLMSVLGRDLAKRAMLPLLGSIGSLGEGATLRLYAGANYW